MLRKTFLTLSVLMISACGGGGNTDAPTGIDTIKTETVSIDGTLTTTTINKPQKINLLINGDSNTVYIQSPISLLKIDGTLNKIDFANGVTVDTCEIKGTLNKSTKSDLLILNCEIEGDLNTGF